MAKDISVNTQSGDFIVSEDTLQTSYWNVVWGKLLDSDESEYMNIVVPSGYINNVHLKDGKFECRITAEYYPVNSTFLARLVTLNVATGKYVLIQNYATNAPTEMGVEYYPTFTGRAQSIMACQLPLVDVNGRFNIVFQQYPNNNFSRAIIYSAKDMDFTIGNSDSQSAQLLARCAPGKYYRYPTTGLDLTKYINSVVEHTDMVESLVSQFTSDSKQISEAEFDSATGDLQVVFSGTKEAEDENLTDPNLLDVSLFKIADDDFVRAAYKSAHNVTTTTSDIIEGLSGGSFLGIYDVGGYAALDKINVISVEAGAIGGDGNITKSYFSSRVATMKLEAGRLYVVNYNETIIQKATPIPALTKWLHEPLFAVYSEDGNTMLYFDEPFYTESFSERLSYSETFQNRRCFIPLQDLIVKFYAGATDTWVDDTGWGIRPVVDEIANYNSILGLASDENTGVLSAMVSVQSVIENVKIDVQTNQILVIKQNI